MCALQHKAPTHVPPAGAQHVESEGYDSLLRVLGSNLAEFLENLNNLHLHMAVCWPAMKAPSFRCEEVKGGLRAGASLRMAAQEDSRWRDEGGFGAGCWVR
jgi:hypothetical protein